MPGTGGAVTLTPPGFYSGSITTITTDAQTFTEAVRVLPSVYVQATPSGTAIAAPCQTSSGIGTPTTTSRGCSSGSSASSTSSVSSRANDASSAASSSTSSACAVGAGSTSASGTTSPDSSSGFVDGSSTSASSNQSYTSGVPPDVGILDLPSSVAGLPSGGSGSVLMTSEAPSASASAITVEVTLCRLSTRRCKW